MPLGGFKRDGRSLFFIATSDGRRSIWRSDLTRESTRPIVNAAGWYAHTMDLVVLDDRLLVLRCSGWNAAECELWRAPKSEGRGAFPRWLRFRALRPDRRRRIDLARRGSDLFSHLDCCSGPPSGLPTASDAPANNWLVLCEGVECWRQCFERLASEGDYVFADIARMAAAVRSLGVGWKGGGTFRVADRLSKTWRSGSPPGSVFGACGRVGLGLSCLGRRCRPRGLARGRQADSAAVLVTCVGTGPG